MSQNQNETDDKRTPPDPKAWWAARRRFAIYGAVGNILTLVLAATCGLYVGADVLEAASSIFISSFTFHTTVIISYIAGATYIDKVTNPLS